MKIKLSSKLLKTIPGLTFHCYLIKNISNKRRLSNLFQLLRGASVVAKNELKKPARKDFFEKYIDHTLTAESTLLESYVFQSRIKKIQGNKEPENLDNLTNFLNLLSFKFLLPIFAFDLDNATGDYSIDFFTPKKGKKTPDFDFNSNTKHFLFWFPNLTHLSDDDLQKIDREVDSILSKYLQSSVAEKFILNGENSEYDLGYTSEKELEFQRNNSAENIFENPNPQAETDSGEQQIQKPETETIKPNQEVKQVVLKSTELTQLIKETLLNHYASNPELSEILNSLEIETPKDLSHGDYATSIALKLAKRLAKNPMDLAVEIKSILPQPEFISEISVLPPGFINFHLSKKYLLESLGDFASGQAEFGNINLGNGQKVMIEYGSLNIAKPFGAHHFLTTVIGQTLVNLYRATGFQVIAADWPGDMGTQFGNLIHAYKAWGNPKQIQKDPIPELLKLYIKFHEEVEKDPSLEAQGRAEYKKLEEKDPENLKLWQWIVEESIKEADKVYQTMGVKHDWRRGESAYVEAGQKLLEKFKTEGKIQAGENGAYIIDLESDKLPPLLVQKADGTTLYATRDLASIEDRSQDSEIKKLVYVVDSAQTMHFNQIFAAAKKLGLTTAELKHVIYGRMSLPDGSMSTRKGNIILGKDLLEEAVKRSSEIIKNKAAELPAREQKHLALEMAVSAIKYAMIAQAPESNFTFDFDKVLSFEGNSAPYLEYTLARAKSILRKSNETHETEDQTSLFSIETDQKAVNELNSMPLDNQLELKLLKLLLKFPDKLKAAVENYKPNLFTSYLIELAQEFNSFYQNVPVLKSQNIELKNFRLKLISLFEKATEKGLRILGLSVFEKM